MSQNILELWEHQRGEELCREATTERVAGTFRARLQAIKQAAERRIDDWIGELDDAQSRPDRDF